MTLKERLHRAISALGGANADALIEKTETRLQAQLGHFPTLKQRTDAFEKLVSESGRSSTSPALPQPAKTAQGKPAAELALELCDKYQALNSDEERRAFWRRNEKNLSDPKAKIPGLVQICMLAAKPLSIRAQFQLPVVTGELVMTKKDFLALTPFEKGLFQARGGQVFAQTISRSVFEKLSNRDRLEFCRTGKLTD
jgi:hypothetical protein